MEVLNVELLLIHYVGVFIVELRYKNRDVECWN